jgi:hypothetical protein
MLASSIYLNVMIIGVVVFSDDTTQAPIPAWAQYGILGLIIIGFLTKQLVMGWLYQDIKAERDLLKTENNRLVQLVLDTQQATLPALQASTVAVGAALDEIKRRRGST